MISPIQNVKALFSLFLCLCYVISSCVFAHALVMELSHEEENNTLGCVCASDLHTEEDIEDDHKHTPYEHDCFEICMDDYTIYMAVSSYNGPRSIKIHIPFVLVKTITPNEEIETRIYTTNNEDDQPYLVAYTSQYIGVIKLLE